MIEVAKALRYNQHFKKKKKKKKKKTYSSASKPYMVK